MTQDVMITEAGARKTMCPFISLHGQLPCRAGACALWIWRDELMQRAYEGRAVKWRDGALVGYEPITDVVDYEAQGYTLETDWTYEEDDNSRQWRRWWRPTPERKGGCSFAIHAHATATRPLDGGRV